MKPATFTFASLASAAALFCADISISESIGTNDLQLT